MHKFDKMFQNKNIINKIFVFNYAQINLRKSQEISVFFAYYFTPKLSFQKGRGKICPGYTVKLIVGNNSNLQRNIKVLNTQKNLK